MAEHPSKDDVVVELGLRPAVIVCPAAGERLDVRATLVDLTQAVRDTAHDMHTLVTQESGYSMSNAQLYIDRQVTLIDTTARALAAYIRSRP